MEGGRSMKEISVSLRVRATGFVLVLCLIGTILVVLNTAIGIARFEYGVESILGFSGKKLILDEEANIPTWFQSMLMFLCALLLAATAQVVREKAGRYSGYWLGLSVIFLLMSLDEVASIHEMLGTLRRTIAAGGIFYQTWVIPASVFLLVLGVFYLKFLLALPRRTAAIFVLAGSIFVGGALGMEMLGSAFYSSKLNEETLGYFLMTTVEEAMEISGLILFIYGLLQHLAILEMSGARPARSSFPSPH